MICFCSKIMKTKIYYLIEPREHGNGGCSGETLIDEGSLEYLLGKNPYNDYRDVSRANHPYEFHPRICFEKDMDKVVYYWDDWYSKWEKA